MDFLTFVSLGFVGSLFLWQLATKYTKNGLLTIQAIAFIAAFLEQAVFGVRYLLYVDWQKTFSVTRLDVIAAGADIDLLAMTLQVGIYLAFMAQAKTRDIRIVAYVILIFLSADGVGLIWALLFRILTDKNTHLRSIKSKWFFFWTGLVELVTVPIWAYYTYITPPITSLTQLYTSFKSDVIHQHHFFIIFVLGWMIIPTIWAVPQSSFIDTKRNKYLRLVIESIGKLIISIISILNLSLGMFILWIVSPAMPTREDGSVIW